MENIKIYELEENSIYTADQLKKIFEENKQSVTYEDYYKKIHKPEFVLLNPLKVVNVGGYPYGYLKTNVKYSLLRNNYGTSLVFQSQNPKTLKWNKPKKSNYSDVGFLVINGDGHIKTISIGYNDGQSKHKAFEVFIPFMDKEQKIKFSQIYGYEKTMENVTFSVRTRHYKHRITGEIMTSVPFFDLKNVDECTEEGVLIDKEKEKKEEGEKEKIITQNMQYYASKKYLEVKP